MEENQEREKSQKIAISQKNLITTELLLEIESELRDEIFCSLETETKDWINIQEVIKKGFRNIVDIIKKQNKLMKNFEGNLAKKLEEGEIDNKLNKRASVEEVKNLISHLCTKIEEKIDKFSFDEKTNKFVTKKELNSNLKNTHLFIDSLKNKTGSKKEIKELEEKITNIEKNHCLFKKILENKIEEKDVEKKTKVFDRRFSIFEERLSLIEKNQKTTLDILDKKIDKDKMKVLFDEKADKNDLNNLREKMEEKADLNSLSFLQEQISNKVNQKTIDRVVNDFKKEIDQIDYLKTKEKLKTFENFFFELEKKFDETKQGFTSHINNQNLVIKNIEKNLDEKITAQNYDLKIAQIGQDFQHQKNDFLKIEKNLEKNAKEISEIKTEQESLQKNLNEKKERFKKWFTSLSDKIVQNTSFQQNLKNEFNSTMNKSIKGLEEILLINNNHMVNNFENFKKNVEELNEKFASSEKKFADKKKFVDLKKEIEKMTKDKKSNSDKEKMILEMREYFENKIKENMKSVNNSVINLEKDIKNILKKKMNFREFDELTQQFIKKQDFNNFDIIASTLQDFEKRINNFENQIEDFEKRFKNSILKEDIKSEIQHLQNRVEEKFSKKEFKKEIGHKANASDINKILISLQKNLESKVERVEIEKLMEEQDNFNQFFCTELILARYKWKSGIVLKKNVIPLEYEVVNTLKENFIWVKNSPELIIKNGGLYEIKFGFFGKKKPIVKLLVNNKVIYTSSDQNKIYKSENSDNNTMFVSTGISKTEFLLLSDNSKISLAFVGDLTSEAFLNIKRY